MQEKNTLTPSNEAPVPDQTHVDDTVISDTTTDQHSQDMASPNNATPATEDISVCTTVPASTAEKLFRKLSTAGPLVLLVLLFAQGWMWLIQPTLYAPCEESMLEIVKTSVQQQLWLAPMKDGMAALPALPWLTELLSWLSLPETWLYPLTSLICAAIALLGTWTLGMVCGVGIQAAFAAGCLLLSGSLFPIMAHMLNAAALTGGILAFALAGLLAGWRKERAWLSLPLGFICTALAGLSGGLFCLIVPLLASLIFLIWTCRLRRAQRLDALLGFTLLLVLPLSWISAIILTGGHGDYLNCIMTQELLPISTSFWPPADPVEQPLLLLLGALAPWPLIILFTSWGRVIGNAWSSLCSSRHEHSGHAWLWICLCTGLLFCLLASTKPLHHTFYLLPLGAILLGKALLRLSPLASRMLFCVIIILGFIAAVALAASTVPAIVDSLPIVLPAFVQTLLTPTLAVLTISATLLVACLLLGRYTCKKTPGGALLVTTLLVTLLMQPICLMLAPSLNGIAGKTLVQLHTAPAATQSADPTAVTPTEADTGNNKPTQPVIEQDTTPAEAALLEPAQPNTQPTANTTQLTDPTVATPAEADTKNNKPAQPIVEQDTTQAEATPAQPNTQPTTSTTQLTDPTAATPTEVDTENNKPAQPVTEQDTTPAGAAPAEPVQTTP